MQNQKNVLGEELQSCCKFPMTGYMRDGYCAHCADDEGQHTVCIEVTDEFLEFSKRAGNDLSTSIPEYDFPGLIAGDRWCLCAPRWVEAYKAGAAPKVILSATNQTVLNLIPFEALRDFAAVEESQ
jgi:hypothetical protein